MSSFAEPIPSEQAPCAQCGEEPAWPTSPGGWCAHCEHERHQRFTASLYEAGLPKRTLARQAHERDMIRRALRLPEGTPFHWRSFEGEEWNDGWVGYHAQVLAFPLREVPELYFCPWTFNAIPRLDEPCAVPRWYVWKPGERGVLRATWTPDDSAEFTVLGVRIGDHGTQQRLFDLLRGIKKPGPTPYFESAGDLEHAVVTAIRTLRRQRYRSNVTQVDVAGYFSRPESCLPKCSGRQLRAWFERFGLNWQEIRAAALADD